MVNKVTLVGFWGDDRLPWIHLCPKLHFISLAWLGFEIALLKGLICNWIEKARICLNACWYQVAPSWFLGGPNSLSHGSACDVPGIWTPIWELLHWGKFARSGFLTHMWPNLNQPNTCVFNHCGGKGFSANFPVVESCCMVDLLFCGNHTNRFGHLSRLA